MREIRTSGSVGARGSLATWQAGLRGHGESQAHIPPEAFLAGSPGLPDTTFTTTTTTTTAPKAKTRRRHCTSSGWQLLSEVPEMPLQP